MSFIAVSVFALYRLTSDYRDAARAQKQNRQPEAPLAGLSTAPRHLGDKIGVYQRGLIGRFASHSSTTSIPQSERQNIVKNTRLASRIFLYVVDLAKYIERIGNFFPDFPGLTGNSQGHRLPARVDWRW